MDQRHRLGLGLTRCPQAVYPLAPLQPAPTMPGKIKRAAGTEPKVRQRA
jgi:hypothetical protein